MQPPPLPLAYAPPPPFLRRNAVKCSVLVAFAVSAAWLVVSPDGWRLAGACALFPVVLAGLLRWLGAVRQFATGSVCLMAAAVGLSLCARLADAVAHDLSPAAKYFDEYVVLPEWQLPLALMSFLWLPAFLFVLSRGGIEFADGRDRREVVPFVLAMGLLFSAAHPAALLFTSSLGGHHAHLRTISSHDDRYRVEVYKGHWLGEARYFVYLREPGTGLLFGRRILAQAHDWEAGAFAVVPSADGTTAELRTLP